MVKPLNDAVVTTSGYSFTIKCYEIKSNEMCFINRFNINIFVNPQICKLPTLPDYVKRKWNPGNIMILYLHVL